MKKAAHRRPSVSREHVARGSAFVLGVRRKQFQHAVPMRADGDRMQLHGNPSAIVAVPSRTDRRPLPSPWPRLGSHHEIRLPTFRFALFAPGCLIDHGHVRHSSTVVLIKYNINR